MEIQPRRQSARDLSAGDGDRQPCLEVCENPETGVLAGCRLGSAVFLRPPWQFIRYEIGGVTIRLEDFGSESYVQPLGITWHADIRQED